jgi:hypothetical protein
MKSVLLDLFTSKKFLAALTAMVVYIAGRFGFDVDTAVLDRIYAALLVYIGAQGIADSGKGAAQVTAAAAAAAAAVSASSGPAPRPASGGITGVVAVAVLIGLASTVHFFGLA